MSIFKFNKTVKVRKTQVGSHGDHWGAVFGFAEEKDLKSLVFGAMEWLGVLATHQDVTVLEAAFSGVSVRGVQVKDQLATLFPVCQACQSLPVTIKEIIEWEHVDGIEAQVTGGGRGTFGLNFFAVDYIENKAKYLQPGTHAIALSGLGYIVERLDGMPDGFAPGFCSYLPNPDMSSGCDYNFIGDLLAIEDGEIQGQPLKLITIKLINDENRTDMFNLPIAVAVSNVRSTGLAVGDKISGCFWLHGRLVDGAD